MMLPVILTALTMGYRQALFTGFLPLSTITARGEIAATAFRIVTRWSAVFLLAILIGAVFIHLFGPFLFHRFIHLEYLIVLFLGIIHLLNLSGKHEHFRNFIYNKRWLYSLGMLQGFSALGNIPAIYAITDEISFPLLLIACLLYGLAYTLTVSVLAALIGLMANISQSSRSALVIIISLLGIIIGIIHFFTGMI